MLLTRSPTKRNPQRMNQPTNAALPRPPARWSVGLFLGLAGVLLLLASRFTAPINLWQDIGPLLVLGSSLAWSTGSFVLRYRRVPGHHLAVAAYQMLVGGVALVVIGLFLGETEQL